MTDRRARRYTLRSKIVPAQLPEGVVVRGRLIERLSSEARCTIVSAPPGYGKTVAVRHWIDALDVPVGWFALDLLDREPRSFWAHLLSALDSAVPDVSDEAMMLLDERGPGDAVFLGALLAGIEAVPGPMVLVLDGLAEQEERGSFDGLALLVERAGGTLKLVITARSEPPLPLAMWRSAGWLGEIGPGDLRLSSAEALAIAAETDTAVRQRDDVLALNQRVDGWPIGFHMALLSRPAADDADDTSQPFEIGADRSLASHLAGEVLGAMGERERQVALDLSVLERFDPDLCDELLGPSGADVVRDLLRRGMFLSVVDSMTGTMQFHALFRELMEAELGWRDPARRIDLHRRAAVLWRSRGDLMSAYHHLTSIGEGDRAHELLVGPAFELVDRGDLVALREFARRLPTPQQVGDSRLALDLAVVAFFAGGPSAAQPWCERAASIGRDGSPGREEGDLVERRLAGLRSAIALADADLEAAAAGVDAYHQLAVVTRSASTFEQRMPIVAARVMLASRRGDEADMWISLAERITDPEIVTAVTVPILRAWHEWLYGALDLAVKLSDAAIAWMEDHHVGAHHFAFDALITAAWCRLSIGDLAEARRLADRASKESELLGGTWDHLQAGFLAAQLALVTSDPVGALRIIDDLRSVVTFDARRPYADRLLALEIEALAASGQLGDAASAVAALRPGPRQQLLRARFEHTTDAEVAALLAGRAGWPTVERLQAELILLTRAPGPSVAFTDFVAECADAGWVLPFLATGSRVERLLQTIDLGRVHPRLARALGEVVPGGRAGPLARDGVRLTGRELTLLELLPSHLSYAEIGARLFLSVNTVKSNLKSLYRKLGVTTRTQAVEAGHRHGLL